jgi:ELWxxDGT repeat protein
MRFLKCFFLFLVSFETYGQQIKRYQNLEKAAYNSDVLLNGSFAKNGNNAYFYVQTQLSGFEIWKTNGDSINTNLVSDIPIGSKSENTNTETYNYLETLNDTLVTLTNPNQSIRFLKPDGGIELTNFYIYSNPVKFKGGLICAGFLNNASSGLFYYKNSTFNFLNSVSNLQWPTKADTSLYFIADNSSYIPEIWKTNCKTSGTSKIIAASPNTFLGELYLVDNQYLIYTKSINYNCSIWRLNLNTNISEQIFNLGNTDGFYRFLGIKYLSDGEGNFYFYYNSNIFKSNGTSSGTIKINPNNLIVRQLIDVNQGKLLLAGSLNNLFGLIKFEDGNFQMLAQLSSNSNNFTNYAKLSNNKVVFIAGSSLGKELWVSDYTISGTKILKDINPGPKSTTFSRIFSVDTFCLFGANDPVVGFELFKTDGTENGTRLVKNIGIGDQGIAAYSHLTNDFEDDTFGYTRNYNFLSIHSDSLFLIKNDSLYGSKLSRNSFSNLNSIGNIRKNLGIVNGLLFYITYNPLISLVKYNLFSKNSLGVITTIKGWKSTIGKFRKVIFENNLEVVYENTEGLIRYDKLNDSMSVLVSDVVSSSVLFKNSVFYSAGYSGYFDLKKYNLITKQLQTIQYSSSLSGLLVFNDTLFFSFGNFQRQFKSGDGINFNLVNQELIVWNGTIKLDNSLIFGGELYPYGSYQRGLYKYNSVNGLTFLKSFTQCNNFYNFNNYTYFLANDGNSGRELWRTDGTVNGTILLKDIFPGNQSSTPHNFFEINNKLYFIANNGINGKEIWETDGSTIGTKIVSIIENSVSDPNFSNFLIINNKAYFLATDFIVGMEVWVFNPNYCETLNNGNWNDPNIWNCKHIPVAIDDIKVNNSHKILINSNSNIEVKNMILEQGAIIELTPNFLSNPNNN